MANSILAKMTVQIAANTAQFLSAMDKANSKLDGFSKAINLAGKTLTAAFIADKVFSGLEYGIGVMKDFERQIDTVAAISGATGEDLKQLEKNAVNLAGAFRSIDIARLETELARLGFQTKEIIGSTKAIIDLATATGEDLAKSGEIVGSTLRIFQKDAKESGAVAETLAIGFNTSALALDNFGEAIKYVGPVANAANLSLEQTTALLGVLADNGIKGSMAGTSLRKIISDLGQGAAPVLNQKLKELASAGLSGADAMDEVGRTAYASLLILAKNTEAIDKAVIAQNELKGTLSATSKIMQDNLQGDLDKLNASWDRMFITGSGLIPIFRNLTQSATSFIDGISGGDSPERLLNDLRSAVVHFNAARDAGIIATKGEIELLRASAVKAGLDVGFTWDEAGKKIKSAFRIGRDGSLGPNPQSIQPPPFIKALSDPKVIRNVGYLGDQIDQLEKKIKFSDNADQIKRFKAEIGGLQYEIDRLTGKVQNLNMEFKVTSEIDPFEKFKTFQSNPFQQFETFFDKYAAIMQLQNANQQSQDFAGFLNFAPDDKELEELEASKKYFDDWTQARVAGFQKAAQAAAAFGDIIGDTLVSSIQSGENFGRALAKQVDRAVSELSRLAIGFFLAKAAKDSLYNPIGAIVGVTAGLIAFKALFAGATKSTGSGSGYSGSSGSQQNGRLVAKVSGSSLDFVLNENSREGGRYNTVS